jgi:hypothetical protein
MELRKCWRFGTFVPRGHACILTEPERQQIVERAQLDEHAMQKVRVAGGDGFGDEGEALLRAIDQPAEFTFAAHRLGGDAIAAQRSLLRGQIGANRRRMPKFTTRLCR